MVHDSVFQTLADPTRRRIVEALLGGEQAVNDLVEAMDIHQSGVSRHLHILADAGFVQVRAQGPQRFYSLRPEPFQQHSLSPAEDELTIKTFESVNKTTPIAESWLEAMKGAFSRTVEGNAKAANLCRAFGTGRIIVFFGGLLNFMFLLGAVFGGAKHGAKQKAAVRAATSSGRAR